MKSGETCTYNYNPESGKCDRVEAVNTKQDLLVKTDIFVMIIQVNALLNHSSEGSHEKLSDCNEECKFKVYDENRCIRITEEDKTSLESTEIYNTKEECEVRYTCNNGDCVKSSGGEYRKLRHCEQNCIEDVNNPENPNILYFTFSEELKGMSDYNKLELINRIKKIVVGDKEFINSSNILTNEKQEINESQILTMN